MSNLSHKQGTIKLTWINSDDETYLNSKMFLNLQDAKLFADKMEGKSHLFFQLGKADGENYTWKLLPYGKHKQYLYGIKLTNDPVYKFGIPILAIIGVFFIGKEIYKKTQ